MATPAGYETPIGTLGHSLSVGERFRVAIARAVLRDPAVLIIEEPPYLDEDTAALLDDTLNRVMAGRTVIFLPSRAPTLKAADRIVVLRKGKIEAVGSHEELRQSSKLYQVLRATEFGRYAETA